MNDLILHLDAQPDPSSISTNNSESNEPLADESEDDLEKRTEILESAKRKMLTLESEHREIDGVFSKYQDEDDDEGEERTLPLLEEKKDELAAAQRMYKDACVHYTKQPLCEESVDVFEKKFETLNNELDDLKANKVKYQNGDLTDEYKAELLAKENQTEQAYKKYMVSKDGLRVHEDPVDWTEWHN